VKELNQRIIDGDSILKNLQPERAEKLGLLKVSKKFFNDQKELLNARYTYHYGGLKEFQFNIAEEPDYEGKPIFRFGLAFNFQPSRNDPDPVTTLENQVSRFNQLLKEHPGVLSEESFWVWNGSDRTESVPVGKISDKHRVLGKFLFVGKSIPKPARSISDEDLELIIEELEYLYPIYQYVQLEIDQAIKLDKVARICFNTEGWVKPSGHVGKSRTANTHEAKAGFGHEEWLLDFSKLIQGYHYASLEPIHKYRNKYIGSVFNIHLYTINGTTKRRFWIGELKDVEVIDYEQTNKIIAEYKKRGWYNEMENQLVDLGLNPKDLNKWTEDILFNIRFKPENALIYDNSIEVEIGDASIPSTRYNLLNFKELPSELAEVLEDDEFGPSSENYKAPKLADSSKRISGPKISEIPHIHYRITEELFKYLKKNGFENVEYERRIMGSSKVDMIGWKGKKATFFEIKTYPNAKACIREALGQVLEYAMYPADFRADKLVIVSQNKTLPSDQAYIKHLRKSLNLKLEYWAFDYEKKALLETVK
ncbi:MAG TPA: hypothetical protein DEV63_08135, partial [Algoriphagus sp.]|nr:hypothetical protein [Algoriphagus sp.]